MRLKTYLLGVLSLLLTTGLYSQDLLLTGVFDGPLTGGTPKAFEFYVVNDIADLSIYGIGVANNGGGSDGLEYSFPADNYTAGDYVYITANDTEFNTYFGFDENYSDGVANVNGDDAIEIYFNGVVYDVFGDVVPDGTGQPWEYQDSWFYRNDGESASTTWVSSSWTSPGLNANDGESSNSTATAPFPVGTYSNMSSGVTGCTNGAACNFNALATVDDGSCAFPSDACDDGDANTINDVFQTDCSCVGTLQIFGCIDPLACNFDSAATDDDGSCGFSGDPCDDADATTIDDEYQPDCSCVGTTAVLTNALLITAVYDGPLSGGVPKGVELYALADITDLSTFGIGSANNGGGTDGVEFTFPADAITAGTYIFVSNDDTGAQTYFESTTTNYNAGGSMSVNGDDAIELFEFGTVIDVFGDINTDGSGTAWDYLDSWAHRNCEQTPNAGIFTATNWTYGGINNNDGTSLNSETANPMPVNAFETVCPSVIPGCTNDLACNYNMMATTDDGSCELIGDSCDDNDASTENDVLQPDCSCAGTAIVACDPIAWSVASVTINSDGDEFQDNGDGTYSVNGFCAGCGDTTESWLISNGYDFSAVTTSNLVFDLSEQFSSSVLDLQYTTSYAGDPTASTWISLGTYDSAGSYSVDLSSLSGSSEIYLGFQYLDDGADGFSSFVLSNLALTGDCPTDVTVFDCPGLMANFGDSCDDNDATTFDDVVLTDCTCAGTPFDCAAELANFGDACDDGDANTNNDVIQTDCSCAGTPFTLTNSLVLTAVFDGPLSGGTPKGVEIYVVNDIVDLSIFGIGSANNGGGTDGEEFTFPAVSATAGDFIYVSTSDLTEFNDFFGFNSDYDAGFAIGINGDDAVELFEQGTVIDTFGDINTDGNGEAWEYTDGWAYRNCETGPDGSTFVLTNWTYSGIDALDGEATNGGAVNGVPVGTYDVVCAGVVEGCTNSDADNFDPAATVDDGSCIISGCTDPLFVEFNPFANLEDGTCSVLVVEGCTYEDASNFDTNANLDDGSCEFTGSSCPGDFTGDGFVTAGDLTGFLSVFGQQCP